MSWTFAQPFIYFALLSELLVREETDESRYVFGEAKSYDGYVGKWVTDSEEHPLSVWNRLGNLYLKGGRPDLAAAAYEKSLAIDPSQIESH